MSPENLAAVRLVNPYLCIALGRQTSVVARLSYGHVPRPYT